MGSCLKVYYAGRGQINKRVRVDMKRIYRLYVQYWDNLIASMNYEYKKMTYRCRRDVTPPEQQQRYPEDAFHDLDKHDDG